jgi:protein-disulfide isomerase
MFYVPTLVKLAIVFAVISLSANCLVFSQANEADLRKEIDQLKQEQRSLEKDISEVKTMLLRLLTQMPSQQQAQMQGAPQPQMQPQMNINGVEFDIGDNHILGKESAKFIMVEISDYECPFCGRYGRETFPEIKKQYIDKGLLRYAVIDNPLTMIHPLAAKAAEAAHCAGEQGKFWETHEAIMSNQQDLKDLASYARKLNLNVKQFEDCLNSDKYKSAVSGNMALAGKLGITGVPAFIIGTVDSKNPRKATGVSIIRGALPLENFKREIDSALNVP